MQTTQAGIFVAGDMTASVGAAVAALQGQVAGLTAAHQLGYLDASALQARLAPILAGLRHEKQLAAALNQMNLFPAGLATLARDDTLLCRCEEVSLRQVKEAIASGGTDLHQVKVRTRAGMGYCQGRNCSALIAPIVAAETQQPLSALQPFTVRPPLQPIPLEVLAGGAGALEPD
jgi:bacterioferritin-associated ferredoxin